MSINKRLMWKTASTHGLYVGLVLIGFALLVWIADLQPSALLRYMNWAIVFGSVYFSMKTWRDQFMNGYIRYSQALGYGIVVMLFASGVFAFYNVLYMNILDPESIQRSIDILEESYYELGWSEERIEMALELAEGMQTPVFQAVSTIFGTTFLGLLVSLIVAIFIRKEGDPFDHVMEGVQDDVS